MVAPILRIGFSFFAKFGIKFINVISRTSPFSRLQEASNSVKVPWNVVDRPNVSRANTL